MSSSDSESFLVIDEEASSFLEREVEESNTFDEKLPSTFVENEASDFLGREEPLEEESESLLQEEEKYLAPSSESIMQEQPLSHPNTESESESTGNDSQRSFTFLILLSILSLTCIGWTLLQKLYFKNNNPLHSLTKLSPAPPAVLLEHFDEVLIWHGRHMYGLEPKIYQTRQIHEPLQCYQAERPVVQPCWRASLIIIMELLEGDRTLRIASAPQLKRIAGGGDRKLLRGPSWLRLEQKSKAALLGPAQCRLDGSEELIPTLQRHLLCSLTKPALLESKSGLFARLPGPKLPAYLKERLPRVIEGFCDAIAREKAHRHESLVKLIANGRQNHQVRQAINFLLQTWHSARLFINDLWRVLKKLGKRAMEDGQAEFDRLSQLPWAKRLIRYFDGSSKVVSKTINEHAWTKQVRDGFMAVRFAINQHV